MNVNDLFYLVVGFHVAFIFSAAFHTVVYAPAFVAQTAFHRFPKTRSINQLNFVFLFFGLIVSHQPDVGCNSRVVKQFGGQCYNGFQPVVFQNVSAYFAFTASGITTK
ncbi:hypothetical protein SDC9_210722 [bioreactor metagenome]|uniref:Uncharacterized protein n=1 Tax=bioreactor metagenome TaxID=1076179 RepID=A0A645JJS7_9ZZZZ